MKLMTIEVIKNNKVFMTYGMDV